MRDVFPETIEKGRIAGPVGLRLGSFRLLCPSSGRTLAIIANDESEWGKVGLPLPAWEHISVSAQYGVPSWSGMCWIKGLFFGPTEWVVQYHPAEADYVNVHPNVLYLWRCPSIEFPVPPKECV